MLIVFRMLHELWKNSPKQKQKPTHDIGNKHFWKIHINIIGHCKPKIPIRYLVLESSKDTAQFTGNNQVWRIVTTVILRGKTDDLVFSSYGDVPDAVGAGESCYRQKDTGDEGVAEVVR